MFTKKTNITVRYNYSKDHYKTYKGYTSEDLLYPFAIFKIEILGYWYVANRFSGIILNKKFQTKKSAETWFLEFSKFIDIKDIDLLNPNNTHTFENEIRKANSNIFHQKYRAVNFIG